MRKLNIVIPMAGAGSRFAKVGYKDPKPLIPVDGIPMIRLVIENLRPKVPHRFTFICQKAHLETYDLESKLLEWGGEDAAVVAIDGLTEGAACTVLLAKERFNSEAPLMIANADQWVDVDIDDYLAAMDERDLDGLIMTMKADDPKWSFAGISENGLVDTVVEKKVISDEATVGIYNYRRGSDFVTFAEAMIAAGDRVNNEFYVAPAYNPMIADGAKIGVYNVGAEAAGMYGLGTPADLDLFLTLPAKNKAIAPCAEA